MMKFGIRNWRAPTGNDLPSEAFEEDGEWFITIDDLNDLVQIFDKYNVMIYKPRRDPCDNPTPMIFLDEKYRFEQR